MSEANGNGQQPQQAPVVMSLPPVTYGIGETPDRKNLIIQFQTMYGVQAYPFDANAALTFAAQVKRQAKALNTGLVIARPGQQAPGAPMPAGAIDLSALKDRVADDDDEDELPAEDAAPAA
jgi:hypothetical protein